MLTKCPPQRRRALLSALEEKRGPSMVTTVPPFLILYPNFFAACIRISDVRGSNAGSIGIWHTPIILQAIYFLFMYVKNMQNILAAVFDRCSIIKCIFSGKCSVYEAIRYN